MEKSKRIAYLFPGQGAQYVGMGKDFAAQFSYAKQTIEEAEDFLKQNIQQFIFEGPESELTETQNSQIALYVISMAVVRTLEALYPQYQPNVCSGLSLGEYTALTASGKVEFAKCLSIVQLRGKYMSDACEKNQGEMAVILGLDASEVEQLVDGLSLKNDLWVANFNCPGQVVISGTKKGIEIGSEKAKAIGAKRIIPLKVHGAFHSGLMREAEERLKPHIHELGLKETTPQIVMNVPGDFVNEPIQICENLLRQITSPVRWERGIRSIEQTGLYDYLEIGCGNTLAGMNRRIGVKGSTISINTVEDLKRIEQTLEEL